MRSKDYWEYCSMLENLLVGRQWKMSFVSLLIITNKLIVVHLSREGVSSKGDVERKAS